MLPRAEAPGQGLALDCPQGTRGLRAVVGTGAGRRSTVVRVDSADTLCRRHIRTRRLPPRSTDVVRRPSQLPAGWTGTRAGGNPKRGRSAPIRKKGPRPGVCTPGAAGTEPPRAGELRDEEGESAHQRESGNRQRSPLPPSCRPGADSRGFRPAQGRCTRDSTKGTVQKPRLSVQDTLSHHGTSKMGRRLPHAKGSHVAQ